jgi:hypothetical protein
MTSTALKAMMALGLMVSGGGAMALDRPRLASNDTAEASRQQALAQDALSPLRDLCHEILVDTDEGYGVTNHESRLICDEVR